MQIQDTCKHSWVAGIMYVHLQDLADIAATREVECELCELIVDRYTDASVIDALVWGEE